MSAQAPMVCTAVVTYNGRRFLDGCFRALRNTDYNNVRWLLVDNGGSDGSGEYVAGEFPEVEVLRVHSNAGYARGENTAIRRAMDHDADYVVVCNDDVEMIDPRWLAEAVRAAESDWRVGIVGFAEANAADMDLPAVAQASETAHVVGFSLLLRIAMLREIGLFDEAYFVFGDEDDLAARAALAGYRLMRVNTPILHFGGGTAPRLSRRSAYYQMRNGLRYCIKNRGPVGVMLRAARILDVACSPLPMSINRDDVGHLRMRNSGNLLVNLGLLAAAIAWNAAALPWTLQARRRDRARARRAKLARHAASQTAAGQGLQQRRDSTAQRARRDCDALGWIAEDSTPSDAADVDLATSAGSTSIHEQ